jgi:hypothetical protein
MYLIAKINVRNLTFSDIFPFFIKKDRPGWYKDVFKIFRRYPGRSNYLEDECKQRS